MHKELVEALHALQDIEALATRALYTGTLSDLDYAVKQIQSVAQGAVAEAGRSDDRIPSTTPMLSLDLSGK